MGGKSVAFSHIFLDILKIFCVCFVLGGDPPQEIVADFEVRECSSLLTFFTAFT